MLKNHSAEDAEDDIVAANGHEGPPKPCSKERKTVKRICKFHIDRRPGFYIFLLGFLVAAVDNHAVNWYWSIHHSFNIVYDESTPITQGVVDIKF